jgi:predicted SAM-dependent methyltransferase
MKLNMGCGYNPLDGYLNLDSSRESAAERTMEAHDLSFESCSVTEIKALQLIEHLGFFKTRFFLSECWRVLKPGGTLVLETPDIEKTFEVFLAGDRAVKEAALGWVYGSETPGMNHLYCFPRELLAGLLAGAGFKIKSAEEFCFQPHRPALRFSALKIDGEKPALNSALRRRLLDKNLADFNCELSCAGLEEVIRKLVEGGGDPVAELRQALHSAPAALEYFTLAEENENHPSREAAACARLADWGLQGRLAAEFSSGRESGLADAAAFEAALALGRKLLTAALSETPEPYGPGPAAGAPAVFTLETASAWVFKKKFLPPGRGFAADR